MCSFEVVGAGARGRAYQRERHKQIPSARVSGNHLKKGPACSARGFTCRNLTETWAALTESQAAFLCIARGHRPRNSAGFVGLTNFWAYHGETASDVCPGRQPRIAVSLARFLAEPARLLKFCSA